MNNLVGKGHSDRQQDLSTVCPACNDDTTSADMHTVPTASTGTSNSTNISVIVVCSTGTAVTGVFSFCISGAQINYICPAVVGTTEYTRQCYKWVPNSELKMQIVDAVSLLPLLHILCLHIPADLVQEQDAWPSARWPNHVRIKLFSIQRTKKLKRLAGSQSGASHTSRWSAGTCI